AARTRRTARRADPRDHPGSAAGQLARSGRLPRRGRGPLRTGHAMNDEPSPLANFNGQARLFPLPNLVLFPHVMQPLHIFEPRYRQMTADALTSDRLIALVLLRSGWEADYEGRPAVHPVACLGKVVADHPLDHGLYNILLRGLSRIQITEEVTHAKLYRVAQVELLADVDEPSQKAEARLRRQINQLVPTWFPSQAAVLGQFRKLLK